MKLNQSQLWDYSVLSAIHRNIDLVRNNKTGQLMIRRLSSGESYPVLRALCGISHHNLMKVYDVKIQDGICVSLCEFINGNTLAYEIENNGPYSISESKRTLCRVCDGLSALHKNGIVHRDIKPENIMISQSGEVKIIDYSITRLIKPEKTKDTSVLGTEGYAPPEQFGFAQTNGRADIYSCGVLLNFMLTGKLPDEAMHQGPLKTVIEKCVEIDERKRFSSAGELKSTLQGKKLNARRTFQPLPGFRSDRIFPKILSSVFITLWCLMLFVFINGFGLLFKSTPSQRVGQIILWSDFLIFWTALPYMLFGDMFRLSERINPDNPRNGKYILRLLGILSIVFGIALVIFGVYFARQL